MDHHHRLHTPQVPDFPSIKAQECLDLGRRADCDGMVEKLRARFRDFGKNLFDPKCPVLSAESRVPHEELVEAGCSTSKRLNIPRAFSWTDQENCSK
ncbi:hypothetical protein VNPA141709_20620 [Pseudomonas aeruginosa]|nr:hypothetical protein VNPA141709_20620 [Pseudomonas aeruginosa]GLF71143.1 hypothetical protein VNPA152080_25620 [Pseudomonas aeruginosa]